MTDARSILNDLNQLVEKHQAHLREHPIIFAIACQPAFYEELKQYLAKLPEPTSILSISPGIPIYIWSRLPLPYKAFDDQKEFQQWKELFGEEGDR